MRNLITELADLEAVLSETHHDAHGVDIVRQASARIAELEKSHSVTVAALRAELIHAQQAIQRITDELRTTDKRLTGANTTIALFLGPDGEQHIDKFAAAIKTLMVTGAGK